MKRTPFLLSVTFIFFVAATTVAIADTENLLKNGNLESGLAGWSKSVSSKGEAGCGVRELVNSTAAPGYVHSGLYSIHITSNCGKAFTYGLNEKINVTYEERLKLSYWVLAEGSASFKVGAVLYNKTGSGLNWDVSSATTVDSTDGKWVHVTGYVWATDPDASYVTLRCAGNGDGHAYFDDIELRRADTMPTHVELSTGDENSVEMRIDSQIGIANVTLPGTDLKWEQIRFKGPRVTEVISYDKTSFSAVISGGYTVNISLTKGLPEIVYRISSNATAALASFPHPFTAKDGYIVFPSNEGMSFPVTAGDEIGTLFYNFGSGHGMSMAFW